MVLESGSGWKVSADIDKEMLLALYFRDLAAIEPMGAMSLAPLSPRVKPAAARELSENAAGELRQEWQSWWEQILANGQPTIDIHAEPDFPGFSDSPSLQHLLRAHYGNAYTWTQNRVGEYRDYCVDNTKERLQLLAHLFAERELEGKNLDDLHLKLVELPLAERRAWFVEPDTVILSQELMRDATLFRSYLQPIIDLMT
ncbi:MULTISPECIES: hypothetical protein [Paeniglutamicibacter]|uniref:Uncharacterized protein n=1 Tax=Paeniglutamicibacter sulfureus TaxID=43666 RepID=A0ABU2BQR4_9MICC|nr:MULTISPECIES: hypothetical protein [Paeniglutamicibacter]MCV9995654.1 hypothetical protein [Paeniglutamicibacter sp. ZC-3]MDR7360088.1 hypothetical protein [Paeniglutamicibacter sulfureus]